MPVKPSKLMLDECFAAEDDRFLTEFVRFDQYDLLSNFVARWLADEREWARNQIKQYLNQDLNYPGHEVVVKHIFKHFQARSDHEMLGCLMVAMDRLVRRQRKKNFVYHRATRSFYCEEQLRAVGNKSTVAHRGGRTKVWDRRAKKLVSSYVPYARNRADNRIFSHRTRNHLRRRSWRHFRLLSYKDQESYVAALAYSLCLYRDADFELGENIIDNWSLMHACYFHSDAVAFGPAHANLVAGHSLSELSPAPYQPNAWKAAAAVPHLVAMVLESRSSLIRIWAMEFLQVEHSNAINQLDVSDLLKLLGHRDQRVQQFAAELFEKHSGLGHLSITKWLELLDYADPGVLSIICRAMEKHVNPDRLDSAQMLQLANARQVPVARLGFSMVQKRHSERAFSADELAMMAQTDCSAIAREITEWCLAELSHTETYDLDCVIEFFDSLTLSMRLAAMKWLDEDSNPAHNDSALFARLVETPFDDVRIRLIDALQTRIMQVGTQPDQLVPVWASVILGVHRGGRAKLKAIQQLQEAIASDQSLAPQLLPVLAVAIRSVRAPEKRRALSAIATLIVTQPNLTEEVGRHIPELVWEESVEVVS